MEKDGKTYCDVCGEEIADDTPATTKDNKSFHAFPKMCWGLYLNRHRFDMEEA